MNRIKPVIKAYITQRLACYDSPSIVASAVKKEFGVRISRQVIESHDPTKYAGARLGGKYKEMFHATRDAYFKATRDIAISHKAVRLSRLQRMLETAEEMGNLTLALQILEQAAKEAGGVYTNLSMHNHQTKTRRTP